MTSSIHQRLFGGVGNDFPWQKWKFNRRLPNLELANPKPFAREFLVLALGNSWNPRTSPPITFHPWCFSKTPKEQLLWLRFSSATPGVKILHVWKHKVTQNGFVEGLVFHDFLVAWWTHVRVSTFFAEEWNHMLPNYQIYRPTNRWYLHIGRFFPRLCGPNFVECLPPKKWVPRSCWAITFLTIPWIFGFLWLVSQRKQHPKKNVPKYPKHEKKSLQVQVSLAFTTGLSGGSRQWWTLAFSFRQCWYCRAFP